jgi:hypothetical protein
MGGLYGRIEVVSLAKHGRQHEVLLTITAKSGHVKITTIVRDRGKISRLDSVLCG